MKRKYSSGTNQSLTCDKCKFVAISPSLLHLFLPQGCTFQAQACESLLGVNRTLIYRKMSAHTGLCRYDAQHEQTTTKKQNKKQLRGIFEVGVKNVGFSAFQEKC